MPDNGFFITFEGPDCAGKTTQVKLLAEWLASTGRNVLCTREPGGTALAEAIRNLLLEHGTEQVSPEAELLLFAASRAQHVQNFILPHLRNGDVVICDRFMDSTTVYQGFARRLNMRFIQELHDFCTDGRMPDITFLLDLPVSESRKRLLLRSPDGTKDRIEEEKDAFQEAVRQGFLQVASLFPARIKTVNACQSVQEIALFVRKEVSNAIERV